LVGGKASVCWGAKGGGSNNGLVSRACCASARSAAEELFDELFQAARRDATFPSTLSIATASPLFSML
ncbi:MAG: hypothetical protein LM600_04295, partial [Thaumarchaeota archaeon]|nr:hypothetical protein [Nitrososphaerota archaeon]